MRDYGKVFSSIYESLDFRALSEDGRTLVLYLLTCKHGTIAGVFRVPDGYVCEDLQWSPERVAEGFRNIAEKGFATRCEVTKWVWVRKYLEWNPPENPNQRKAILKCASMVPESCSWKADFTREVGPSIGMEVPAQPNPCATLSEPLPNQYQEQEQEYNPPHSPPRGEGRFPEFWTSWPSSPRKQDRRKCLDKWRRKGWDSIADTIIAHVVVCKASTQWLSGYEPAPLTYLNGERWLDGPPSERASSREPADIYGGGR